MTFADMLRPAESGSTLSRLTRDLTADARSGRLEPVRCRADEISRVVDILLRQGKNNPALVGAAGVGKTAIVEGLAQRIARGEVPLSLRDVRILAVDHVSLLAGTTYRGQYEERIRAIVAESTSQPDVVLFIDELHNLIGQGTAMGAPMDAGNMLKPALVRGDFRVIGATTDDEYEKWVCGDPALERRFQKVAVRELSDEETLEILRARKSRLERHHNVVIADDALAASIELTDAWVLDRMRPDRAIDALDEACAHTHAVAAYDADTERLIVERRELARRDLARRDAEAAAARRADAERGPRRDSQPRPRVADDEARGDRFEEENDDGLERFARGGFAALERFGAEIEAMLGVAPPPAPSDVPTPTPADASASRPGEGGSASHHSASSPNRPGQSSAARSLAELDALLERRLTERGIVVRGHDVARVVGLSVGRPVEWPA